MSKEDDRPEPLWNTAKSVYNHLLVNAHEVIPLRAFLKVRQTEGKLIFVHSLHNCFSLHAIPLSNLMVKFLWWPYHVQYVVELFPLMKVALYHSSFIMDVIHATVWDQSEASSMVYA